MWTPRRVLPVLGALFILAGVVQGLGAADAAFSPGEQADNALLAGCGDIPEVVEMVALLDTRTTRLAAYQASLERTKAELATAEATLTDKLRQLRAVNDRIGNSGRAQRSAVDDDIDRLIGVYDAMKPRDAAAVLDALPPEFAAEILMRVDPAVGAQILAAVEPTQAAILTTHMGARHVRAN